LFLQVFGRDNREVLIEALNWSTSNVGGASTAQKQQQGDLSLAQLRSMLAPFVLRRLKRDVLDQLTEKTNIVKRLTMTPFQKQVYDGILLGHAARKDMLKLKSREAEEADLVLQDKVTRTRGVESAVRPPPVKMAVADLTQPSSASSECVSPFNKMQKREGSTPVKRSGDRTVVSLLSEDVVPAKAAKKAGSRASDTDSLTATVSSSSTSGGGLGNAVFPSEIDLAAIAESSVNSTDIDPRSAVAVDESAAAASVQQLSASEASNLFTALRKAANHPLLLRVRYRDAKTLEKISIIAHSMGHFGNQCDYQRVRDEIEGMSDFDIHQLCLEYEALNSLQLDASALYDSPKMDLLRTLLPQLMVRSGNGCFCVDISDSVA
jgi:SNF2 family DNA or RNA helicase